MALGPAGGTPPLLDLVARVKPTLRDQDAWSVIIQQDPRRGPAATERAIDEAFAAMAAKVKELVL